MHEKKGGLGRSGALAARLLASVLVVVAALVSSLAFAGTLQVKDEESLLSSTDRSALESAVRDYPFDVRVLTTAAHASDFDRYVGEQVSKPDMVVVGVDKEHRRTAVHFGKGSHIAQSEFHAIKEAGNAAFRSGDFGAGVQAILAKAKEAYGTDPRAASNEVGAVQTPTSSGFPFGWVVLGGLVLVAFLAIRRVFANRGGGYQQPLQGQGPGYPGYGQPGYGPGYGPGGGSGLGAGIVGAGLGGLAGYELGKAMGEREQHEQQGGMLGGGSGSDNNDNGNWDAGGDSGGWDDGGGGGDFGGGGDDFRGHRPYLARLVHPKPGPCFWRIQHVFGPRHLSPQKVDDVERSDDPFDRGLHPLGALALRH